MALMPFGLNIFYYACSCVRVFKLNIDFLCVKRKFIAFICVKYF